jgi:hypothetical protein
LPADPVKDLVTKVVVGIAANQQPCRRRDSGGHGLQQSFLASIFGDYDDVRCAIRKLAQRARIRNR